MSANDEATTGDPSTHNASPADDPELKNPEGTLYEQEFWSIRRHELIAGAAEEFVKDPAWAQINSILEDANMAGLGLSDLAGWADRVKRRMAQPGDDEATRQFLGIARNRTNDRWHYVNLPLDTVEYSRETYPTLTRDDDVVQIIRECVLVLKDDPEAADSTFTKVNALRLLVHLVGDVHQPVHVGCCYIDETGDEPRLVRDPEDVAANLDTYYTDQGGNKVILPVGVNGASIHSYWDSRLGGNTPDLSHTPGGDADAGVAAGDDAGADPELQQRTILKLRDMIKQDEDEDVSADSADDGVADVSRPEDWAIEWANESLAAARDAYASEVTDDGEYVFFEIVRKRPDENFDVEWVGREAYDERCKPIVIERMKLAAANLAALLNEIWP
jgi:hypothetical protein